MALQHEWSISAVETKAQAETILTWHEGDTLEQAAAREAVQLRCVTGHCSVCSTGGDATMPLCRYTLTNPGPSVAPAAPVHLFLAQGEGVLSWDQVSLSTGHNCTRVEGRTPPPATRTSDGETKVTCLF